MTRDSFAFPGRWCSGMKDPGAPDRQARGFLKALHGGLPFCRPNGRQCGCATGQFSGETEPRVSLANSGLARWAAPTAAGPDAAYGGRMVDDADSGPLRPVTSVPQPSNRRSGRAGSDRFACASAIWGQIR